MAKVSERVEGHYEIRGVPFGEVYVWRSGHVVLECDCGEVVSLANSSTICGCGLDHASVVRGELAVKQEDKTLHPWRYREDRQSDGVPC